MSLALATRGMIAGVSMGGTAYPVYVPVEEPELSSEETGEITINVDELLPDISIKELVPKIRAE